MLRLYDFLAGPGVWISLGVFVIGSVYKMVSMYALARKKDMASLAYMNGYYSLRSIIRWSIPFGSAGWRENPALTVASFVFHLCLVGLLLFASGHVIMWETSWGLRLPMLSEGLAEIFTLLALGACAFFLWRRLSLPMVRFVTWPKDWFMLALAALPFLTGFLASRHIFDPLYMGVAHLLTGELAIMAIPFTRLTHALLLPANRAYIGSEFGSVRHAIDW